MSSHLFLNRNFQFEFHQADLWISIVIWIHAGLDAVRTPWICTRRRYEKICEVLGYFMYGPDNVVVLTFVLDESPP
jgi:hypothetical protein